MSRQPAPFTEAKLGSTPIRELGLAIPGTPLEPILKEFDQELDRSGFTRVRPKYYLSTEWGVPFGTAAIAMPFYLARSDLTELHAEQAGFIEGVSKSDILRYLRHEMGHVVNYVYRLYEDEEWVKHFGSITRPYEEEYRPQPFSRRFVRHLPGWYAQKHPDEDWAETFAVWMTPGRDWQAEYAPWPAALAKLQYCDRSVKAVRDREPVGVGYELDEDVEEISYTVEQFYTAPASREEDFPPGLAGALRAIFEDLEDYAHAKGTVAHKPASALIRRLRPALLSNVFRWTGHFPERTQLLLRHLAEQADALNQVYPEDQELLVTVAITTLVTALAMNYVHRGSYLP